MYQEPRVLKIIIRKPFTFIIGILFAFLIIVMMKCLLPYLGALGKGGPPPNWYNYIFYIFFYGIPEILYYMTKTQYVFDFGYYVNLIIFILMFAVLFDRTMNLFMKKVLPASPDNSKK